MKLEKAKFCVRCREIFLKPSAGSCPYCAGKNIFPLTKIIKDNVPDINKIKHWGALR